MTVLAYAPFLAVLGSLVVSMALTHGGAVPVALFLTPLFAVALVLLSYESYDIKGQWSTLIIIAIIALLCGLRGFFVLSRPQEESRIIQTHGTVTLVRPWGRINVAVIDTPDGNFLVQLHFATLVEGMSVNLEGYTSPLRRNENNDNGFDEWRYWRARGVTAKLQGAKITPVSGSWNLYSLRYKITRALAIHIPELTSSYLRAAWTGQRDENLNKKHRAWGTSHLLAVSGFHVGLFTLCAFAVLRMILQRGVWLSVAVSLLMWFYVLMTGAAPSALRAGLMLQIALVAELLGRPNSALNSVSVAAVLLLAYSPFLFWDIGWRLSVLAAMTLTSMRFIKLRGAAAWLLLSPLISLVTFAQVAGTFEGVPIVGLILNFVAPTFFTFAFAIASFGAILRLANIPFASLILRATEGGFELWEALSGWLAKIFPAFIEWNTALAWLGTGIFIYLLCRAIRLSAIRTAFLVPTLTFGAFLLFL